MKKFSPLTVIFLLFAAHVPLYATAYAPAAADTPASQDLLAAAITGGGIGSVLTVVLIAWIGIALYLFRIERKLKSIEKRLHE